MQKVTRSLTFWCRWAIPCSLKFPHTWCLPKRISWFLIPVAMGPNAGYSLLIHDVCRSHTTTHHSRYDSYGRVISPSQRPLPENTQHPQKTNVHAPAGFEPTMSAGERQQTYALDRAAAGTGKIIDWYLHYIAPEMEFRNKVSKKTNWSKIIYDWIHRHAFNDVAVSCDGFTETTLVVLVDLKELLYLFQYLVHAENMLWYWQTLLRGPEYKMIT